MLKIHLWFHCVGCPLTRKDVPLAFIMILLGVLMQIYLLLSVQSLSCHFFDVSNDTQFWSVSPLGWSLSQLFQLLSVPSSQRKIPSTCTSLQPTQCALSLQNDNIVRCRYNAVNFLLTFSQNTSHSSPVRARYGMYFVGSNCGSYFASVTAMMYAIACFILLCYNGIRLYRPHRIEEQKFHRQVRNSRRRTDN